MPRIDLKIGDIIANEDGNEFRVFHVRSRTYSAKDVNRANRRIEVKAAEARRAAEKGLLVVRPRSAVANAREIQEGRYRRVACDTLLALIENGDADRSLASVTKEMPTIYHAWFLFDIHDPARDWDVQVPFARPPTPAAVLRWLDFYDGSDASVLPSAAKRRMRAPLEGFDPGTASAVREAAMLHVAHGANTSVAYRALLERSGRDGHAGSVPCLQVFRRIVERMAYAWAGRNAPTTTAPEPERPIVVTESFVR